MENRHAPQLNLIDRMFWGSVPIALNHYKERLSESHRDRSCIGQANMRLPNYTARASMSNRFIGPQSVMNRPCLQAYRHDPRCLAVERRFRYARAPHIR